MFANMRWKVIVGFSAILLCLFVAGYLSFNSLSFLVRTSKEAFYQDKILIETKEIITEINNAESGIRAYVVTNDEYYLTPYYELISSINDHMDSLQRSTMFDFAQQIKIIELSDLIRQKLSIYEDLVSIHYKDVIKQMFGDLSHQVVDQNDNDSKKKKRNSTKPTKTVIIDLDKTIESIQKKSLIKYEVQAQKEISLLKKDKEVMTSIENVVNEMEFIQRSRIAERAATAAAQANRSRTVVSFLIVLTLGIIALLAWLIFNDITKSNQYRNELIEAKQHAENMARVKEEFLANMSHEIRTPLTAIVGFSEQLSKTKISPRQEQFLGAIHKSSDHLMKLVNSVLDFSKIESGLMNVEETEFMLPDVVESVYMDLRTKAKEKKIRFTYEMPNLENVRLIGDHFKLKQILYNLGGNAIKFTDEGYVEMGFYLESEDEEHIVVTTVVSDSGIGIKESEQEKIFNEFVQADNTETRKFGGTGLGLAITKKLIELQGGKIELQSEPGKGSVFTFSLSFKKAGKTAGILKKELHSIENDRLEGKHILFADDDEMIRLLGETILTNAGAHIDLAVDGQDALEKISLRNYDLVLIDVHMPEVSGIEVVKRIRSNVIGKNADIKIIAITADVFNDELRNLNDSGINDFLLKPFSEKELLVKIFRQLGDGNKLDEIYTKQVDLTSVTKTAEQIFNLSVLEQVGKNDPEFIINMLEIFLKNARETLYKIEFFLKQEDWEAAGMMAHKLIPSYEQLGIKAAFEMRKLQRSALDKKDLEKIHELFLHIKTESEKVFELLEIEIENRSVKKPVKD